MMSTLRSPLMLGGAFINNFNQFGRQYKTYVMADQQYRMTPDGLQQFFIPECKGEMVPAGTVAQVRDTTRPQYTNHFNISPRSGRSAGYRQLVTAQHKPRPRWKSSQTGTTCRYGLSMEQYLLPGESGGGQWRQCLYDGAVVCVP